MKRLSCSNSPAALISICASTEEQKVVYSRELPTMMEGYDEEEACLVEECGQKKRRLSVDQVKALEKSFDLENKLEPDRKVKLAQELGLQPRQVAVWFQNRRARWKTKQLERDYGVLKANYDSLKQNLESLQTDNEALIQEIRKLRSKLEEENPESMNVGEKQGNPKTELPTTTTTATPEAVKQGTLAMDFKDAGPSDSDSSAILCAYDSPKMAAAAVFGGEASAAAALLHHPNEYEDGGFEFLNLSDPGMGVAGYHGHYQVKMEEHNFLSEEAPCNFFSEVDQAAILPWYNSENWT